MARLTPQEIKEFHALLDLSINKLESDKNSKKTHWSNLSIKTLHKMIVVEVAELDLSLDNKDDSEIESELKDIINLSIFAMHNLRKNINP